MRRLFDAKFKSYDLIYSECKNCGYVQTQNPTWLELSYSEPINSSDVGIVSRNLNNARLTVVAINALGLKNPSVLDACGGYGMLTRILRDYGFDTYWSDPYCKFICSWF